MKNKETLLFTIFKILFSALKRKKENFRLNLHYANSQLKKHIQRFHSFHGAICEVNLLPYNLNQVKKIHKFLKDLLKEKNTNPTYVINEILCKNPKMKRSVTFLLLLWMKL